MLSVRNIDFSYGQLQVLFDISLDVYRGEALALLGTNGAGKSTLLRVIAGLEQPSAGSVTLAGREITGSPAARLATEGLVLVPGGRSVCTDMTVEENLEMQALGIRKQRGLVRERTELVLATFPCLAERLSQPAGRLSGGEQQQPALAKALLLDPDPLCIDERRLGLGAVGAGDRPFVEDGLMRPFQEFRFWARRAPLSERVGAGLAALIVVGLVAWLLVPDRHDTSTNVSANGGNGSQSAAPGAAGAGS